MRCAPRDLEAEEADVKTFGLLFSFQFYVNVEKFRLLFTCANLCSRGSAAGDNSWRWVNTMKLSLSFLLCKWNMTEVPPP